MGFSLNAVRLIIKFVKKNKPHSSELFEQVLEMMERIESEDEMEDKGRKEEEEERLVG